MSKLNKKLLAAGLGAAAVAVTTPVILTSCSQETQQNSGEGQDVLKSEAIVSIDGNTYSNAIVLDATENVESIKNYFTNNVNVVNDIKDTLLSNKSKFNHVDLTFKDVASNNDGTYSLIFSSSLENGFSYVDGTTNQKDVNVVLTNLSFKDAVVVATYDYNQSINVYENGGFESLESLQNYLTKNSNEELNKIVNDVKTSILAESTNVESIQYVNNSINEVNDKYQMTLLASAKDKHLFADGNSQKTITLNLNNVEFGQVGAVLSTNSYILNENDGNGAFAQLKEMNASLASAEQWLSQTATANWLSEKLASSNKIVNANVAYVKDSVKAINNDNGFTATFDVIGNGNYVFEDGSRSKQMTITFSDAGWKFATANSGNYSHYMAKNSAFWGPNQVVANATPNDATATKYVEAWGVNKAKDFAQKSVANATVGEIQHINALQNGNINIQFVATANNYYRFANGSKTTVVTVTLTNVQWKSVSTETNYAVASNTRFDAKDIEWFKNHSKNGNTVELTRKWLVENGGLKIVNDKLQQDGVLKNASLVYESMWDVKTTGYYWDDNHIQAIIKVRANGGYTFADGSNETSIEVIMDNMPWK